MSDTILPSSQSRFDPEYPLPDHSVDSDDQIPESSQESSQQRGIVGLRTAVALLVLVASLAFLTDAQAASTYERRLAVMRQVWGSTYREALTVAVCESRLNPRASNGQFKGVFQMGRRERARWGHGPGVSQQARAAKRYYTYAKSIGWGNGWGPWECKPYG